MGRAYSSQVADFLNHNGLKSVVSSLDLLKKIF